MWIYGEFAQNAQKLLKHGQNMHIYTEKWPFDPRGDHIGSCPLGFGSYFFKYGDGTLRKIWGYGGFAGGKSSKRSKPLKNGHIYTENLTFDPRGDHIGSYPLGFGSYFISMVIVI